MPPELTRLFYWVIVYAMLSFVPQARLIAPFGRPFLRPAGSIGQAVRDGRVWAEAITVSVLWWGIPVICSSLIEEPLRNAGVILPWIGDPRGGGSAYWWFVGAGSAFGLLYRSALVALITAAGALAWQWAVLGGPVTALVRESPLSNTWIGALLIPAATGLLVGIADAAASYAVARRSRGFSRPGSGC
ncbi:MAG: hypothetical protein ACOY94_11605 [Bacillota bacterium]